MSFLKIKDPSESDKIVAEYLETEDRIQEHFRSKRLGVQSLYQDFGKIFKPTTEQQQKSSEEIVSKLEPLQEAIENSPALQALPWGSQAEALPEHPLPINIGPIIGRYLIKSYGKKYGDKTFGLKTKDEKFFIGKSRIKFEGDNLEIDGKSYKATPGLMNLITMEVPKVHEATKEDKDNYLESLNKTGALYKIDKNGKVMITAPRSDKYRKIIKPLREEKKRQRQEELETLGQGFLPSDPNALCERLDLLMASKQAGNTGLRNEIVSIYDERLRQKILSRDAYKNLMLTLNK